MKTGTWKYRRSMLLLDVISDQCLAYTTIKNWDVDYKRERLVLKHDHRLRRSIFVITTENIDFVHGFMGQRWNKFH